MIEEIDREQMNVSGGYRRGRDMRPRFPLRNITSPSHSSQSDSWPTSTTTTTRNIEAQERFPSPQSPTDMAAPEYEDVTADIAHNHNASAQHHVAPNHDPALDISHEHQHPHLHHDVYAEHHRPDEVVYSQGTTFEKSTIPPQDPQDHDLHRRYHPNEKMTADIVDAEKGTMSPLRSEEEDPKTHTMSTFYAKYRIFFHLVLWLFFTGSVLSLSSSKTSQPGRWQRDRCIHEIRRRTLGLFVLLMSQFSTMRT